MNSVQIHVCRKLCDFNSKKWKGLFVSNATGKKTCNGPFVLPAKSTQSYDGSLLKVYDNDNETDSEIIEELIEKGTNNLLEALEEENNNIHPWFINLIAINIPYYIQLIKFYKIDIMGGDQFKGVAEEKIQKRNTVLAKELK